MLLLVGCGGGSHFSPLEDAEPPLAVSARAERAEVGAGSERAVEERRSEGTLEVTAKSAITSYLGRLRAVVTDAEGRVVAGADAEGAEGSGVQGAPDLRLTAPEGDDYTLTVTASTSDPEPTTCRAVVGPLRVVAQAVGAVRILAWDCGGVTGYVPNAAASECFWLAQWLFVGPTRAAVGQDIQVSAAGHDAQGNQARFDWSVPPPSLGRFAEPSAARTSFRCQAPGTEQPLTVAISDAECLAELSQDIACQ
ncbi:MAG: hypothetical protein EOO73_04380 [Myxococcales bacterium]|nr:MAG: hypothetical protein EOO73_04380 [Myxococcales bacterium]